MNEKIYKSVNQKVTKQFKDAATWVVDNKCTDFDNLPLSGIDRTNLILEFSDDMALGSLITKNKYIGIGCAIGVAVSVGVVAAYLQIKKSKKNREVK